MKKNVVTTLLLVLIVPAAAVGGGILFREKYAGWVALCVAVLSCLPLFYSFERKEASSKELTVLAVLIALSAAGRLIFAWLPGFKPITALTVIAALWLGKEAGFAVGALAAVLSNFYFGQGPWTPFQMFAWGMLGFLAGLLAKPLKKSKILLCLFGVAAGLLYSATMDIWVTVWEQGGFNLPRYGAALLTSLPLTAEYAVSNVIFLLLLTKPIGEKLERIKIKYGLFKKEEKR
ncbi:MAG: ECF transporter S component [Clostridia bacterium]|nr:ECF transporter S component [Clostridia bacterium]